ncbi:hypothetical protein DB347_03860 [Opitutaceae bacterium EW11]|nr:hypothetical protein DB347_03860 [Opitutaceae bacterium EW11]
MSIVRNTKLRAAAALMILGSLGGLLAWRAQAQPHGSGTAAPSSAPGAPTARSAAAETATAAPSPGASAGEGGSSAKAPALWKPPAVTQGTKLDTRVATDPAAPEEARRGRRAVIDGLSVAAIEDLKAGQEVTLPLLGGDSVRGRVNLVQPDSTGWIRAGGELTGGQRGSFTLGTNGLDLAALVQLPDDNLAYELAPGADGRLVLSEKRLSDVVCFPMPGDGRTQQAPAAQPAASTSSAAVPVLSSRPAATAVLYMDFDGEVVSDPAWAKGATIAAQASPLTSDEIAQVWKRVKEDYAPFNIDVTTDVSRYNNAPVGRRIRVIVTPTDTASPGSGGVAYVNSFAQAGTRIFSSTIPAWVFNQSVEGVAEAISHEAGHTFGLSHDGRTSPAEEYYRGQGSGATSWAPIMGAAYGVAITQWSKGEYANANNHEDDVAIIGNTTNGFGFVSDGVGGNAASATSVSGGALNQAGVIAQTGRADWFRFTTGGGTLTLTANPAPVRPNLDVQLQVFDSAGNVVMQSSPDQTFNASLSISLAAGTYYTVVQGVGHGNPLTDGYSNYGSLGAYTLTGTIPVSGPQPPPPPPAQDPTPSITSSNRANGNVGVPFSYQIAATGGVYQYAVTGALPPGVSFDKKTGFLSGTPTSAGNYYVEVWAANATKVGHLPVTIGIYW